MKYETSARHDLTNAAGAGILVYCASTRRVLLGLRGMDAESPETWCPFGGMVDPGETPEQAALREVQEEAGLRIDPNALLGCLYVNHDMRNGFKFYTYVAVLLKEDPVTVETEEMSGYGWFRVGRMPKHLHPGFYELLQNTEAQAKIQRVVQAARTL